MSKEIFKLVAPYEPRGDQVSAIKEIKENFNNGIKEQILLGATGTGKTFTIANIIQSLGKKTLIMAPNKTLAGQLFGELKSFFPQNRVEYFISYYDYYQPEAYVISSDTYIEKDAAINDEIDELRHSATSSLISNDDVIVVASVSCIYGIGDIDEYKSSVIFLRKGEELGRSHLLNKLVDLSYERSDVDFKRGTFRVRGDVVDIVPINERSSGIRVSFFGDEIDEIREFDIVTGTTLEEVAFVTIPPATHFVTSPEKLKIALERIRAELDERIKYFTDRNMLLEAQRIKMRTQYDLELLEELGFCSGVENYSRHLALKAEGETPNTLIDFFGDDFLMIIDESHVAVPQIRGMFNGDRSRKTTLVEHGFRLPSALDNRPLRFKEFEKKVDKVLYLSATPGDYELNKGIPVVEQIIRPTYLVDPVIEVRPTLGQIDDLYNEIKKRILKEERVLVTTLTIKMSEDLTTYFKERGLKVAYLHSKIKPLERIVILRDLRLGKYDVLVGINLLREGLDLPEVSLVAILDADKQGFLRSTRSLIQTTGRAARNVNGKVIMYADEISASMEEAITETNRRRKIQQDFNLKHNLVPETVFKEIRDKIGLNQVLQETKEYDKMTRKEIDKEVSILETRMKEAARNLEFELAAEIRDLIYELKASR